MPRSIRAGQRLSLQQLHDDEELTVLLGELVHLADIRMADLGGDPRLAEQPFLQGRMAVHGAEAFDGDQAVEPVVAGLEHHAHAAFAELTREAVLSNSRLLGEARAYCRGRDTLEPLQHGACNQSPDRDRRD